MKSTANLNPYRHKIKYNYWSFEKKISLAAICIILAGFVTFGEVLGKISQLNDYMKNTNDMREQLASLKATTSSLIIQTDDIKQSLNRIENHLIENSK